MLISHCGHHGCACPEGNKTRSTACSCTPIKRPLRLVSMALHAVDEAIGHVCQFHGGWDMGHRLRSTQPATAGGSSHWLDSLGTAVSHALR
jgi:hypothetical protein